MQKRGLSAFVRRFDDLPVPGKDALAQCIRRNHGLRAKAPVVVAENCADFVEREALFVILFHAAANFKEYVLDKPGIVVEHQTERLIAEDADRVFEDTVVSKRNQLHALWYEFSRPLNDRKVAVGNLRPDKAVKVLAGSDRRPVVEGLCLLLMRRVFLKVQTAHDDRRMVVPRAVERADGGDDALEFGFRAVVFAGKQLFLFRSEDKVEQNGARRSITLQNQTEILKIRLTILFSKHVCS